MLVGAIGGVLGAVLALLPRRARELVVVNLTALVLLGLFAGLARQRMLSGDFGDIADQTRAIFASKGLTIAGALLTMVVSDPGLPGLDRPAHAFAHPCHARGAAEGSHRPPGRAGRGAGPGLPWLGGAFVAQTVAIIALYILMGLGLNITLGFAGLLDLGFVAFFAVGAYTVALLTSTGDFGLLGLPVVGGGALRGRGGHGLRRLPGPAHPGHPGRLPGHRDARLRRDHRHPHQVGRPEAVAGRPAGHHQHPAAHPDAPADFLYGPVQIYYVALACAAVIAFVA